MYDMNCGQVGSNFNVSKMLQVINMIQFSDYLIINKQLLPVKEGKWAIIGTMAVTLNSSLTAGGTVDVVNLSLPGIGIFSVSQIKQA